MTRPDQAANGPVARTAPHQPSPARPARSRRETRAAPRGRTAPPGPRAARGPARRHHQRDVGPVAADRVEPEVPASADVHLRGVAHVLHARHVGDEGDPAEAALAAPAEPAGHDRAEPVGADREPGARSCRAVASASRTTAPGDAAADRAPALRPRFAPARSPPARRAAATSWWSRIRRETERPVGRNGRRPASAKRPWSRAPRRRGDRRSGERHRAGRFQGADHAEAVENAHRLGAHVLGAGLVAGELGPVHHEHGASRVARADARSRCPRARRRPRARRPDRAQARSALTRKGTAGATRSRR